MSDRIPRHLFAAAAPHKGRRINIASGTPAQLIAAKDDGQPTGPRRFTMSAYNGGAMGFEWSDLPVIVDLAGLVVAERSHPIFFHHDPKQIVGHSTEIRNDGKSLAIDGVVSGKGQAAQEVVDSADAGFPWQSSIGVTIYETRHLRADESIVVNGETVTGPLLIVTASNFFENSFVTLGADSTTTARMVAAASNPKESPMNFEEWLASLGFDPATLSDAQKAALQKAYDAEMVAAKAADENAEDAPEKAQAANKALKAAMSTVSKLAAKAEPKPKPTNADPAAELRAQMRTEAAAETRRLGAIRKVCAGKHDTIEAKAIEEGWTSEKVELEVLRAERATGPTVFSRTEVTVDGSVLEASVLLASRVPKPELYVPQKSLEAAQTRFRGGIGLQQLLLEAAWANGFTGRSFNKGTMREILAAAFGKLQAGASTIDIAGILSNTANKFLLAGWMAVEQTWKSIAAIRAVNDFKTNTSYRMTGDLQYNKVGPNGEIEHGSLGEESFTNKADTYAKMLAITRQDQINDDLGAISAAPTRLGRGAGLKLNDVFWTEFFANHSAFFSTANKNRGANTTASALGIDGLTAAELLFLDQVDPDGKPLGVMPSILLHPNALSAKAATLMNSAELRDTTANTKAPVGNPHAGKFTPVASSYLGNAAYGNDVTGWYIAADPRECPMIEVAFLNGQEAPTVETADADFDTLGIQMRGFHDFGVAKQDHRGAVFMPGKVPT